MTATERLLRALAGLVLLAWAAFLIRHAAEFFPWKFSFPEFFNVQRFASRPAAEWISHWFTTIRQVLILAVWLLGSCGMGLWVLDVFRVRSMSRLQDSLYAIGLGFSFWMLLVFLLGILGALKPGLFLGIWLCLSATGIRKAWMERGRLLPGSGWLLGVRPSPSDMALAAFLGLFLFILGLSANAPELFFDALEFHLAVPAQWILHGGIIPLPANYFSNLPMNVQMLYTGCLMLGDERLCRMLHLTLGILGGLVVFAIGRRWLGRRCGWWALAIYLSTPLLALNTSQCGIDGASTFYSLLAFLALADCFFAPSQTRAPALLAGWLLGIALGCKNTAAILLVPACASAVIVSTIRGAFTRSQFRSLLTAAGLAVALLLPWMIKSAVYTGNPFYPMFFQTIPSRNLDAAKMQMQMRGLQEFGSRSWLQMARLPWDLTFKQPSNNSFVGVVFLFLAPGVFVLAWRCRRGPPELQFLMLTLILAGSAWFFLTQITRYLLPVLGILAIAGASALEACDRIGWPGRLMRWATILLMGICAGSLLNIILNYQDPAGVALGFEKQADYLHRKLMNDYTPAAAIVNEIPDPVRLLSVGETRAYYFNRPVTAPTVYDTDIFIQALDQSSSAEDAWKRLREQGYTHIFVNYREAARIRKYESYRWNEGSLLRYRELEARYLRPVMETASQSLFAIADRPDPDRPVKAGRPLFTYDRETVLKINEYLGQITQAYTSGDLEKAAALLQICIQLAPDWGLPYLQLGSIRYRQNRADEALAMIRRADELIRLDPTSLNNLRVLEERAGSAER